MAQINKYQSQELLEPQRAGMPSANVRFYDGSEVGARALGNLGDTLQSVGAMLMEREEKKENFKATEAERRLQLTLGQQLEERSLNMVEDGEGFHDDFMANVYRPAREKFMESIPERLREQYGQILGEEGSGTVAWSVKAAEKQRDQSYKWYDGVLNQSKEQLATAISMEPDAYDDLLQRGFAEIDASGLPETQKEAHRRAWEEMAQVSHLNRLLETNPERVLRELGADPRYLTPTTQFNLLRDAVINTESSGDPNAVSPKGAIGLMQVMPETGGDIARWMGDKNFPHNGSELDKAAYLANPYNNKRYGEFYLRKQIKDFGAKGGLEAALIAYNGGPVRAKAWIESGFDDSVLPRETREYYKKVMRQLPMSPKALTGQNAVSDEGKFDPANVTLEFKKSPLLGERTPGEGAVNPDLVNRVKTSFAALGIDRVRINSGFRDAEHNRAVGGAENSQHTHAGAMDIDVSGYSKAKRIEIIRTLSANGITGIGVGANIVHADLGGRRAWGYAKSSGGGEVPAWAKDAIAEHLAGAAAAGRPGSGGRYSTLPYAQRQKFIQGADKAVTDMFNTQNKASMAQKTELRRAIANEVATVTATGVSTGLVDETDVATILGESDYSKYVTDLQRAQRVFRGTEGVDQMTPEEMETRRQEYEPIAGSPTYADDIQVENAVQKAIDRTLRERATKPVQAALKYPEVAEAWAAIETADDPDPASVREFVRLNLERQKEFGLKPGSEQPLPRQWSIEIGRSLSRLPDLSGGNANEVNAAILLQYEALQKVFGDHTDEVILQALSDFKGIGKNTGEVITGYMQAIQAGGDPMGRIRQRLSAAEDRDSVEELAEPGIFGRVANWFSFGDDDAAPDDGGEPEPTAIFEEKVSRVSNMIEIYGGLEQEDEAHLIERFGEAAVRAAKQRRGL